MSEWQSPHADLEEQTIADLQVAMESGQRTSRQLVEAYIERIQALDASGPMLRSVIEVNPDALHIADELDRERQERRPRGPLHGIPILLKDNIDTADKMETTAGSLALLGAKHGRDAFVVQRLRMAGAVLLGKTNMSEWANFRSTHSSSGWSARGGQARNPYALDRTPCGSSSGSASAVAANLCAASVGTETDGSILCPASINGVVGIKPTVGLTSRSGVIPISHSQDTVGPFARTVADAAILLGTLAGEDADDLATHANGAVIIADYREFLNTEALRGARIGIPREVHTGYSEKVDVILAGVVETLKSLGAEVVDPANLPSSKAMHDAEAEMTVLLYEFKHNLNTYLTTLGPTAQIHSLDDAIAFNREHAAGEMPYFAQELFEMSQEKGPLTDQAYRDARAECLKLARDEGIDAVMREHNLDALCMPTAEPAWKIDLIDGDHSMGGASQPAALAGYPAISVPAGYTFGLPIGVTFMGLARTEPKLIGYAYAFEQATRVRKSPTYPEQVP
jgi:amidase